MLRYLLLPKEVSAFEKDYLTKLNRVTLIVYLMHVPVMAVVGLIAGTGAMQGAVLAALACIGPLLATMALASPRLVTMVHAITVGVMGGVLVHVGQGPLQIEMHFYFFVCLALLSVFANPLAILVAAGTIAAHHLVVWLLFPASVFNHEAEWTTVAVHALFVVMESVAACFVARVLFDRVIGAARLAHDRGGEIARLHALLAGVRRIGMDLSAEARVLSASATRISDAAGAEAASVEQSSATLSGLATSSKNTAEFAARANDLAVTSCSLAAGGADVMQKARTEMAALLRASSRVSDITVTIDELSFQTNLLALNAAVEAARAGEHGRGFAVVAHEVRDLAARSTKSAREIRSLIQGSLEQVQQCVALVEDSGDTLSRVATSAGEVEALMRGISTAAQDESINISELSRAVDYTTSTVQKNAAQASDLAGMVARLTHMSNELANLIDAFPDRERRVAALKLDAASAAAKSMAAAPAPAGPAKPSRPSRRARPAA